MPMTLNGTTGIVLPVAAAPAFSATNTVATSLSGATWTKIAFQTEEFDTNSNFDSTTNYRFTPTVAGYYQFNGSVQWGSNVAVSACAFYKNGTAFKFGMSTNTATTSGAIVSALIYLNGSSDYVEFYAYSGVGNTTSAVGTQCYFQASMVRSS